MCFVCFSHRVSLLLYYHLENCSLTHKLFSMISSETKSIVSMWSLISVNILSNLICLLKKYDQVLWLFLFLFSVLCTLSLVSRHLNKKGIKRSLMCMYKKIRVAASCIIHQISPYLAMRRWQSDFLNTAFITPFSVTWIRMFLAPTGAQRMLMSICLCVCALCRTNSQSSYF